MGPVLFVTNTHDVPRFVFPKFADDFNGLAIAETNSEMVLLLQAMVDQLCDWARRNGMELNAKTKVMCFGPDQITLNISMNGVLLKQIDWYKFLGVLIDKNLDFEMHTEYACGKAKSALNKVSILLNGRYGLPVPVGIELYKGLIRHHLEYAAAAWMFRNSSVMKSIQSVQHLSLKKLCGVFKSSSGAALEVITGVCPIDTRLQQLCRREWARIKALESSHPLQSLLEKSRYEKKTMTPLSYVKHCSKKIDQMLNSNSASIKQHQPLTPELILESKTFEVINIFKGKIGSSKTRSRTQQELALNQMNVFLNDKLGSNVLVFSDGSVMGNTVGNGGCGVVVVPPDLNKITSSKFVSKFTENVECEVEGVVLALSEALNYCKGSDIKDNICYIFTDCESAIDIFCNQNDLQKWSSALRRSWEIRKQLEELGIVIYLAWVPGHCGIMYNELADTAAKQGCSMSSNNPNEDLLPFSTISKWIDSLVTKEWQEKWNRCETGQFTKEIVPKVTSKINIPSNRDQGISLIRCLLNNASVNNNLYRMNLVDDPDCECEKERQTVEHVIMRCERFKTERLHMKLKLISIWECSRKSGDLKFDLNLLLNPFSSRLNAEEAQKVANEFRYFLSQIEYKF